MRDLMLGIELGIMLKYIFEVIVLIANGQLYITFLVLLIGLNWDFSLMA